MIWTPWTRSKSRSSPRRRFSLFGRLPWNEVSPPHLLLLSFSSLIAAGTIGLKALPGLYQGEGLTWLDALFTSTSAVCVTGLIAVDTATYFTPLGQGFLLVLIQLGGLGILTFATLALLAMGKRLSLQHQALSAEMMEVLPDLDTGRMVRNLVLFTLSLEALGALVLFLAWAWRFPPGEALWHAVFHSISAFCNAGFSTFSDSLTGSSRSPLVLGVVMILIIAGGLGFLTIEETRWLLRTRPTDGLRSMSLHSRLVITVTAVLLVGGWGLYMLLEWNNTLSTLPVTHRIFNGLFMSVTARTAGFNTVDYSSTGDSTNFLTILLMSVGGSPGSTAGGLKTTTFAVIGLLAWARLRGDRVAGAWGRSVPEEVTQRAVGLFVLMFATLTVGVFLLTLCAAGGPADGDPRGGFMGQMFEAASAFNTVGLSTGLTGDLTGGAKAVIVLLMFLGRVGPLTVAAALARERTTGRPDFRFTYETVLMG